MAITKSINEYQITVVGKIKDVNIPTNHRYVITKAMIKQNKADDGYELWVEIRTYKDNNHTFLLENNLFTKNNLTFPLGATLPTKNIQSVVKTQLESWMDDKIGTGKWEEITK